MRDARSVTVEITGIMPPTTHPLLLGALDALWAALQFRSLGRPQWQWFEYYLTGPGADRFVGDYLDRTGPLSLPVMLPEGVHHLRIQWAPAEAGR
ncbi:hypothetical protein OH807_12170 [Kitasatospora sp. NBC_01560]|uniref:hypothetical protein n=1 Tax=Kitasatospora sp. NBC_01560 TaxID=2975965 RepID=UPI00386E39EF